MLDTKKIWDDVLTTIELAVPKTTFSMWFKGTHVHKHEDGVIYLSVPNAFVKDWLVSHFHKNILKNLRELSQEVRGLEYIISKNDERKPPEQPRSPNPTQSLPIQEYINKDDNLNPRYTFESFVVGPFNELAHAASQAVIKNPGRAYNPFFIFGNTGHGKTHLIQAIGNFIKKTHPEKKVYYVSSEKFAQDYVNALQSNQINSFKDRYRKYDVFIMDDIQFLSNKEKVQEEVFHLFNALHENNKQIVFSCDKHPNVIPNLEDRLRSRFSSGMIVDIPYPDFESRAAIIKTKAQLAGFSVSDEIINYVAQAIEGNIRELEGILNSLVCQTQLKSRELSLNEVKNLVRANAKPKKTISVKDIVKIVADFYNIEEESIYDKTRRKEVVRPRQVAMYLLREDCSISYPSIGQKLGGRDHTTVIHSCEKVKNDIKTDTTLSHEINQIRSLL